MAQNLIQVPIELLTGTGRGPQGTSFGAFLAKFNSGNLKNLGFSEFRGGGPVQ
jgi:hypothetical protein